MAAELSSVAPLTQAASVCHSGSLFEVQQAIEMVRNVLGKMEQLVEAQGSRAPSLPPLD